MRKRNLVQRLFGSPSFVACSQVYDLEEREEGGKGRKRGNLSF
jgi:hypothetical protein